jgi:hypothetical protein
LFYLTNKRFRGEHFAVFIFAPIVALAASTCMFEKGICRKGNSPTNAAADNVADGLADRFAN